MYIGSLKVTFMKGKFLILCLLLAELSWANSVTTRGGFLTTNSIGVNTYQVSAAMIISGDPLPGDSGRLDFGDGNYQLFLLDSCSPVAYGSFYKIYLSINHTYSPGQYSVVLSCGKRPAWIRNLPNSDTTSFILTNSLIVDPSIGPNSRPDPSQFLLDPAMNLSMTNTFTTVTTDADGDSVSWYRGFVVPGYQWPENSGGGSFNVVNPSSYDWNPQNPGMYMVQFQIADFDSTPLPNTIMIGWSMCELLIDAGQSIGFDETGTGIVFTMAPNPSAEFSRFSFATETERELVVYDASGRVIWKANSTTLSVVFPAHQFANGIYTYTILEATRCSNGKLIIQH